MNRCLRWVYAYAVRWPCGIALGTWRYARHVLLLRRVAEQGEPIVPPPLPENCGDDVLWPGEGAGPLFHRRYRVWIEGSPWSPERLMARIARDLNAASPVEIAVFDKETGGQGCVEVGDEFVVRLPGPWDGPVRVVDRAPTRFRLVTRQGHLEAGQIEFRVGHDGADLRFEIESWARSGDRLADLLYDKIGISREMQMHMWVHFCKRVCKLAQGKRIGRVEIHTGRWTEPSGVR
ncbi:MAG: hypothetical protein JWO67_3536 [Streptosporangiaceae bacterium]|jgi:hypothetical protein|nr:hypothetical protein [Streptosporangiaceae bacterium]